MDVLTVMYTAGFSPIEQHNYKCTHQTIIFRNSTQVKQTKLLQSIRILDILLNEVNFLLYLTTVY